MRKIAFNASTAFILTVIALTMISCGRSTENNDPSDTFLTDLEHSSVILMPEGEPEDIQAFLPLKPTVVAWGNDPVSFLDDREGLTERTDSYYRLGITLQACNVWMLTATARILYDKPRYQDAVCLDIEGNPVVPRWLDGDYKGVKYYWGCTNNPLFRSFLAERTVAGIAAGANMLHLDDHLGTYAAAEHSGGCFCDDCLTGFRSWLEKNYTEKELALKGISDIISLIIVSRSGRQGITH